MSNQCEKEFLLVKSENTDSMEPERIFFKMPLPHRCSGASWELPWRAHLWLERELLFDMFQHRWSYVCETLGRGWGTKTERSESTSSKNIFPKKQPTAYDEQ